MPSDRISRNRARGGRVKRWFLAAGACAGLFVLLWGGLPGIRPGWVDPPPHGSRIEAEQANLKTGEVQPGSLPDILYRAAGALPDENGEAPDRQPAGPLPSGMGEREERAARFLEEYAASLQLLRSVDLRDAPNSTWGAAWRPDNWMGPAQEIGRLASVLRRAAHAESARGRQQRALRDLEQSLALALVLACDPADEFASGYGLSREACRTLQRLAWRAGWGADLLAEARHRLAELEGRIPSPARALRRRYPAVREKVLWSLEAGAGMLPAKGSGTVVLKEQPIRYRLFADSPRITLRNIEWLYLQLIAAVEGPWNPWRLAALRERIEFQPDRDLWRRRDPVGRFLAAPLVANALRITITATAWQALSRTMRLWLAVAQHERETGRPPTGTEMLIPGTLKELPADPFGEGPIRYRLDTDGEWRVYSVGPDGMDGRGGAQEWFADDDGQGDLVILLPEEGKRKASAGGKRE